MYYPYLRGRQNELLGLQELLDAGKLGGKVVPVIEPVKFSSTFINTLRKFVEKRHPLILIKNRELENLNRNIGKHKKNMKEIPNLWSNIRRYYDQSI